MGVTPPMFSLHSVNLQYFLTIFVNSVIILCHLVNSARVFNQVAAFWFDVLCADGKSQD